MVKYNLIQAIDVLTKINVAWTENGKTKYGLVKLQPGVVYKTDDPVLINSLKNAKITKRYTKELDAKLKREGIEAEKIRCSTCGGAVTNLKYKTVEVHEDGN